MHNLSILSGDVNIRMMVLTYVQQNDIAVLLDHVHEHK